MLRKRREDAGLTRKQLSELSGVPARTIEEIEVHGSTWTARAGTIKKLADAFGVWMDCLLTDEYDTEEE